MGQLLANFVIIGIILIITAFLFATMLYDDDDGNGIGDYGKALLFTIFIMICAISVVALIFGGIYGLIFLYNTLLVF